MKEIKSKIKYLKTLSGDKFFQTRNYLMRRLIKMNKVDDLISQVLDISMKKLRYSSGKHFTLNQKSLFYFCNKLDNSHLGSQYIRHLLDIGISRTLTDMDYQVDRNVNLSELKGKRYCFKTKQIV